MKKIEMVRELGKVQVVLASMRESMKKQEDIEKVNVMYDRINDVIDSLVNDEEESE